MMPVHEYEKHEQLKLEKLKRHVAKGVEQAGHGETTAVHNKDELHSLLKTIKQQNRSGAYLSARIRNRSL